MPDRDAQDASRHPEAPSDAVPVMIVATAPAEARTLRGLTQPQGRDLVLRTAAAAFNRNGFHRTSLEAIARQLDVTKPVLYSHASGKDDILLQCVHLGLAALERASREAATSGDDGLGCLRAIMLAYGAVITQDFGRCVVLTGDETLPPERRAEIRAAKRKIDLCFRDAVAAGVADGSIRPCDPKFTAFALAGALSWIARWYDPAGPQTAQEVVEACTGPLIDGLALARPRQGAPG